MASTKIKKSNKSHIQLSLKIYNHISEQAASKRFYLETACLILNFFSQPFLQCSYYGQTYMPSIFRINNVQLFSIQSYFAFVVKN